jgi:electron transfer flavoprotein alpha subunit
MATVRPGIFKADAPGASSGKVTLCDVSIDSAGIRTQVIETHQESSVADITKAKTLVVGGRGTKGDFRAIEKLAGLLGGQVGATRVAVDEGWVSREIQIGQTGYASRPKVAVVCGVSGALQFTVGIAQAQKIVAINSDPDAPIFESADYCLVGNLFEILPALIEEAQAAKEREVRS